MREPKGTIIGFLLVAMFSLLAFGSIAVDVAAVLTTRTELRRTSEAAALAGAGALGFDSSAFPAVAANAIAYAASNPSRVGPVSLGAPGDIVLGIWAGGVFTPSADGTQVNAVRCQAAQAVPTSFAGLVGIGALGMSAQSIAVANPPNRLPPTTSMFPVGVTSCPFQTAGAFTSAGCGTAVTFAPGVTNTAAWVSPVNPPDEANILPALAAANAGGGPAPDLVVGQTINAATAPISNAVNDALITYFVAQYNASPVYSITDVNGNVTYAGQGWEVFVPLIETPCPPGPIAGSVVVQTFARFLITQVINGGACAVSNPADPISGPVCAGTPPGGLQVFGYYHCGTLDTVATRDPAPRAALATRLRLVQ